jgi:two-component system, chemotaxis family, chemotaxis protein CheY
MAGRTALIVDDSVSMRQMVSFTLAQVGFEVLEAGNGAEGLAQLERRSVDLIITDLNMPVMDGISFIRNVRQRQGSRYTPALMLTTESQSAKKQEGKAAGATGWIVKPFNPEQLVQVVAKVVR